VTSHIPDQGEKLVRYYCFDSKASRGFVKNKTGCPHSLTINGDNLKKQKKGTKRMKKTILTFCMAFALMGTGLAADDWLTDWSAFVKQLSIEVTKDKNFVGNVNNAFSGKSVEWVGKVTEIKKSTKPGESSLIRLAMKPEALKMSGSPTLDNLTLIPEDNEWDSWKTASVGDSVRFSTTLDEGSFLPKCVLIYMVGMGQNAGKTVAWINTKGGKCLGVNPKSGK